VRLDGEWKRWCYEEAFAKLIPVKIAKASQEQGIAPPALVRIGGEWGGGRRSRKLIRRANDQVRHRSHIITRKHDDDKPARNWELHGDHLRANRSLNAEGPRIAPSVAREKKTP
jgi:hypothetical protein